jgi:hypothetical protein
MNQDVIVPDWARSLKNTYCSLRTQKRNKTLRRMYYRQIENEKLELAKMGKCQECIKIYCRYLSNLKTFTKCKTCESGQFSFQF